MKQREIFMQIKYKFRDLQISVARAAMCKACQKKYETDTFSIIFYKSALNSSQIWSSETKYSLDLTPCVDVAITDVATIGVRFQHPVVWRPVRLID
jgi:hypothetical protein